MLSQLPGPLFLFLFLEKVSSPDWPQIYYAAKNGFELLTLLPLSPEF